MSTDNTKMNERELDNLHRNMNLLFHRQGKQQGLTDMYMEIINELDKLRSENEFDTPAYILSDKLMRHIFVKYQERLLKLKDDADNNSEGD